MRLSPKPAGSHSRKSHTYLCGEQLTTIVATEDQITLEQFLETEEEELRELILTLAEMSTRLRAEFSMRRGSAMTWNPSGEEQMAIDKWASDFIVKKLSKLGTVMQVASEEMEPIHENEKGRFSVTIDPLDGSSNIDSNNIFGTIVGIYEGKLPQPGVNLIAAFYEVYGPITTMILTLGKGVHEFIEVSRGSSQFILSKKNMVFPDPPMIYGAGAHKQDWIPEFSTFIRLLGEKKLKTRYGGAMVGDFNQVLIYGGIFCYPSTMQKPKGKLRLVFEANPIGFIAQQAGGKISNGRRNTLNIMPSDVHQRTPVYVGNRSLVEELEELVERARLAREELD